MDDKEIMAGFEELFGGSQEEPEAEPEETDTEEIETDPETLEEEAENPEEKPEDEPEPESKEDKQKARQNYEFARLRTENKKQAQLLKNLGKVIGMDEKATPDQIAEKVQELILQKESKDKNIPVELLQRMQELESIAAENTRIKIENETQKAFTALAEKYNLDSKAITEFAVYLGEQGKNPLDGVEVDIEMEYVKLHHNDIVKLAVEAALAEEAKRKEKVDQHAGSGAPGGSTDSEDGGDKIKTVADLDKYFSEINV